MGSPPHILHDRRYCEEVFISALGSLESFLTIATIFTYLSFRLCGQTATMRDLLLISD